MAWIAAAIGAAQTAVQMIPSEAEEDNNQAVAELKRRKAAGELGLTDEEREMLWNETYGNAQRKIDEQRMRGDATMAATGNTSGGAMQAQQASQMNATAMAASQAAQQMNELDVEKRDAELQELTDRLAVKQDAERERILQFTIAAGKAGENFGEYEGLTGEQVLDKNKPSSMDGWKKEEYSRLTPEQQQAAHTIETLRASGDPESLKLADALEEKYGLDSPESAAAWGTATEGTPDTGTTTTTPATDAGTTTTETTQSATGSWT